MKQIKVLILSLVISLLSLPSWGETMDDLAERNCLYFKKFTDTPFTGMVTGQTNGRIKNGKMEGHHILYWDNGQLKAKGNYKDGIKDGAWETYDYKGEPVDKVKYRKGITVSVWEWDPIYELYKKNEDVKINFNEILRMESKIDCFLNNTVSQ